MYKRQEKYGLDKPLGVQYVNYMKSLLHGDLGLSLRQRGRTVNELSLIHIYREELTLADPRCVEYLSGREVEARTAADGWCCAV